MKSTGDEVRAGPGLNVSRRTYLMDDISLTSLCLMSSPLRRWQ